MADIPVNWGAAPVPQDYTKSALEGAEAGQAQRGISALQGIDLNDPDSLNKGIGNLVRAGAADQASALIGLQIQRSALAGLPGLFAKIGGLSDNSPTPETSTPAPPQPTGAPAASPTAGAATGSQQPDPQALAAVNAQMAADARTYSQTPPDQQPALAASLKQKYLGMGFPEVSIDAALAHAATPGGADQLASHYDAHAQALTGGTPDQAAMAPPGGSYAWTAKLLNDPGMQAALNLYKKYGIDMTGLIGTAEHVQAPMIAKEAEIAAAPQLGTVAAQTAGKVEAAKAPYALDTVTLPSGETAQVPHNLALELGAGGALHGLTPEQEAEQKSAGAAAGSAPYDLVTLKGPSGEEIQVTRSQMAAMAKNGGLPTGPSIGSAANQAGQAEALNKESELTGQRLAAYPQSIAKGQTLLGLANTVGTGAYTAALSKAAQALPVTGSVQKYATDSSALAQDLAGSFKDALNGLPVPRITSEAKSITGAIPKNTSPQDQVKVYAAGNLAATQYQQAHDQFIQQWAADPNKPRDLSQAQEAWASGPGARSLFTMPAWQGVTVAGKPAVDTFQYKGHTYAIPLPGLLGNNSKPILVQ
jgi:hypothetical protein